MKSLKTVYLTALSILFYGLNSLLQHGKLIFPFPINDYLILVIAIYLIYLERKALKSTYFVFGFLLFSILQNIHNYELFLSQDDLLVFNELFWIDIFQVFTLLFFFAEIFRLFFTLKHLKFIVLIPFSLYFLSIFQSDFIYQGLQFTAFVSVYFINRLAIFTSEQIEKVYFFESVFFLVSILKLSLIVSMYLTW